MKASDALLVVGADGMIGRCLAERLLQAGHTVVRTVRWPDPDAVTLDLTRDAGTWEVPTTFGVAYLCAAVTSLEDCRTKPAESTAVNVTGTVALARRLMQQGTLVVFPSSNLVFCGSVPFQRPDACLTPLNEYGRQKAEAERQLQACSGRVCIVRFTKVLGPRAPLLTHWVRELGQGHAIHPLAGPVLAPLSLDFAVEVLQRIGRARPTGILQASGPHDVSYAAVARHVARRMGADPKLVQPIDAAASGRTMEHVPRYTTLDTERLRRELQLLPPDVWATIDAAFA